MTITEKDLMLDLKGCDIDVLEIFSRPADRTTASAPPPNLASLSRIKNRADTPRSSSSQTRFLACWATQPASGFSVIAHHSTRRLASSR